DYCSTAHILMLTHAAQPTHASVPTRRSSDLSPTTPTDLSGRNTAKACEVLSYRSAMRSSSMKMASARASSSAYSALTSPRMRTRSEEHTSELQSREKLVCRLLLENKKKPEQE